MTCTLCPRMCSALRTPSAGAGQCRMPDTPVVARAALHHWEEPPISGHRGSGTIFFSGCPLSCVFCQNRSISQEDYGVAISTPRLREICTELIKAGAHNINFVNPTHYAHVVREVLSAPLPVPVVWNSGGYDRAETLRSLEGRVDIYLPDLKYMEDETAQHYSGAADYPRIATAAIREMVRQQGRIHFEDGILTRGVVIRHLILPGAVSQAKAVMDWVAETFAPGQVLFSLMSQYTPWGDLTAYPRINRTLRQSEYRAATEYMQNLGLSGFSQDGTSAQVQFTPPFDGTGVTSAGGPIAQSNAGPR